jgi:hypothetical protein
MGSVEIESEWTARRRETNKMLLRGMRELPPFAKNAKDGAPDILRLRMRIHTERLGHPPATNKESRVFL